MQEANRDRLDVLGTKIIENAGQCREVQRRRLLAAIIHPARRLATQMARHKGLWLLVHEIEKVRTVAAGDFKHVAKPFGGNERRFDALPLGESVDDHCGAVGEKGDGRDFHLALCKDVRERPFRSFGGVVSTLAVRIDCRPVSSSVSKYTRSVKVPPTSVATRTVLVILDHP